jgi:glycosyltransferase involved in cell wall biosynthesis
MRPKVTVAFTTYNVERYLAGAFDAVRAQELTDFEVVVADNGSTDSTWDICERYAREDARFRIYRNPENIGVYRNVRRVIELAGGQYFRLTAHDDLMAPTLLGRCVAHLDAHPEAVLAYPRTIIIDEAGRETTRWAHDPDLRQPEAARRIATYVDAWALINELFGVIRTDALKATRPFGTYNSSDKRLMVELLAQGQFHLIDEFLFYRRIHGASTFGTSNEKASDVSEVYGYLDPQSLQQGRIPASFAKPTGDHGQLTRETFSALLHGSGSSADRLRNAGTFLTVWETLRLRIWLGAWRRRLMRTPLPPAPWEAADAAHTSSSQAVQLD